MKQRPLIFISNDDGYQASGLYRLIDFLLPYGDIVAVCPDGPRSGQSCAITVNKFLRIKALPDYRGASMFKVDGTPVDCVKLGMHVAVDRKPDLLVAGINHGSNSSINVIYSGTMGAVFEGCACGIPSIGFSLTDHSANADFSYCRPFVEALASHALEHGLPEGICLNVNIPANCDPVPTQMRLVNENRGFWSDEYVHYIDPHGKDCYFLAGEFVSEEPENQDTDEWCLAHGIVSVVPVNLWRRAQDNDLDWVKQLCNPS